MKDQEAMLTSQMKSREMWEQSQKYTAYTMGAA